MTRRMKIFLVSCSVFVAMMGIASNMGFKLVYTLQTNAESNNANWIALPYLYQTNPVSVTICDDIGGWYSGDCPAGTATQVSYFNTANDATITHGCTSNKANFNILPGRGYAVYVSNSCVWKIVGAHDDSYNSVKGISFYTNIDNNNINWISLPYHSTSANATQICIELNAACSNTITQVSYFDTANDVTSTHSCSGNKNAFNLLPGRALAIAVNSAPPANCWHPSHY